MLDDTAKADEIARRILSGQTVSDREYRFIVMFHLTAMTQILWELTDSKKYSSLAKKEPIKGQNSLLTNGGVLRGVGMRLLPLLASLAAFLAGLGIGYLIP